MKYLNHSDYYTFLFRTTPDVNRIRKIGGIVYYVGRYNKMVAAIVPSSKQLEQILGDPNLVLAEKERKIALPYPKVRNVFPTKTFHSYSQSSLVKVSNQLLTWNIARVLGIRGRPNNGEGIRVGVIDTGIDLKHPDLAGNIKGGVNFVNPSSLPHDDNGHGTHVAGIIAAANNRRGIVGVAPRVSLYAIKVLNKDGSGSVTNMVKGIEWAIRNKMHILNISISGGQKGPAILAEAINAANRNGILVIAAAGNKGNPSGKGDTVEVPARMPRTVAVAALNRRNQRAPFSATGRSIGIAAPGVNILSTYKNGQYATLSGTSMAAPHVTGAAAILMRKYPKASPAFIIRTLERQAVDLYPKGKDRLTGAGLVQVR